MTIDSLAMVARFLDTLLATNRITGWNLHRDAFGYTVTLDYLLTYDHHGLPEAIDPDASQIIVTAPTVSEALTHALAALREVVV